MQIKTYTEVKNFLDENLTLLEKEEVINNKIIGTLLKLLDYKLKDNELLLSIKHNDLMLWAMKIRNNELMLTGNKLCIDTFLEFIKLNKIEISSIFGKNSLIEYFKDNYYKNSDISMRTILYSLENLLEIKISNGYIRKVKESDKETVISFLDGFLYDCFNEKDPIFSEKTFDKMLKEGTLYVWKDREISSIAGIVRKTKNTSTISYVYTPKLFRKKGYGTSIVYEISKAILNDGFKYSTLFADKNNPNSNVIYKKIGYKKVQDFSLIKITNEH
ncbi:MAG: GNAT family N-acetyltransferase [Candidatus Sericytochromatia bacterium]